MTMNEDALHERIEELECQLSATVSARDLTIRDLRSKVEAVERLVREAGSCGETGCTTVATCELKRALGWSPA